MEALSDIGIRPKQGTIYQVGVPVKTVLAVINLNWKKFDKNHKPRKKEWIPRLNQNEATSHLPTKNPEKEEIYEEDGLSTQFKTVKYLTHQLNSLMPEGMFTPTTAIKVLNQADKALPSAVKSNNLDGMRIMEPIVRLKQRVIIGEDLLKKLSYRVDFQITVLGDIDTAILEIADKPKSVEWMSKRGLIMAQNAQSQAK